MNESPLIGREKELMILESSIDAALSGRGTVVLIAGEAGSGKTRLAQELALRAAHRHVKAVQGMCWDRQDAPPLWPWVQVMRALGSDDFEDDLVLSQREPFSIVARIQETLRSSGQPVLILLEDVHAADEASLHVLRLLAQQIGQRSVLICATHREEALEPGSVSSRALTATARSGTLLELGSLSEDETAQLFEIAAGYPAPPSLISTLYRATEGNPFFVEEMGRLGAAQRNIQRPDRSIGFHVPRSVHDLITESLDLLSDPVAAILRAASVIGPDFDRAVLACILRESTSDLPYCLAEAEGHRVIEMTSALGRFRFRHTLVREALYEGIPSAERARMHLDVAHAIETVHASELEAHAGELADHYFKAGPDGDLREGLRRAEEAGRRALDRHEINVAARYLYRALKIAESLDLDEEARGPLAAALAEADAAIHKSPLPAPGNEAISIFHQEGEYWTITFGGVTSRIKDSKGLRYLEQLLRHPGREFLAVDLAVPEKEITSRVRSAGLRKRAETGFEILDDSARSALKSRLRELQEDLQEAELFNDIDRVTRSREEIQFLEDQLTLATGVGGRARKSTAAADRARMSVTRAIRTAITRISEANPSLGRHLSATVKTGNYVSYIPDPRLPQEWRF